MSRLAARFAELGDRKALVAFITAGDPNIAATVPAMHALVAGGASVIELGIPFSDPEADGPVIQKASERALAAGTRFADVLNAVAEFREQDADTPVLLMGYLNSISAQQEFEARAREAGVDGLILVNLPPEEASDIRARHVGDALDLVFLVAPTTTPGRAQAIARAGSGFLYYVSFRGITGASHLAVDEVATKVSQLKAHTDLPVCVGFGIKDAETAAAVGAVADGVVVGTALVSTMAALGHDVSALVPALTEQAQSLRDALDR